MRFPDSQLKRFRSPQRKYTIFFAFTLFVLSATLAGALPQTPDTKPRIDFSSGVCVGEFSDILDPQRVWMPVGCESRLCCPGCPNDSIDWRIRVSGDPLQSVLFQFDNLSPAAARKLRIKGRARWEGNALRVMPGETVVSGFNNDPNATPVVATPRLFADRDNLTKLQHVAARGADRSLGRMEVSVEQAVGKYAISEARVAYNVTRCASFPNTGDRLFLNNNVGTDNAIALIDARNGSGDCLDDLPLRGAGIINVGDLRPFDVCTSDTAVFSDDNGMFFVNPTIWTDSPVDEQVVTLPTMFRAPVSVWIAINESGAQERAEWDMASANYLYNDNKAGIAFDATYTSALQIANTAREACKNINSIKGSSFYTPGRLNVYYIDNPLLDRGKTCWNDAENKPISPGIIFINRWAPNDSLAHEFGHAFSLDDLNLLSASTTAGIGSNNLMWSGGNMRTNFTIGQAFRISVNNKSMINVNGVRVGWGTRDCPDETATNRCPALKLDVTPK